MDLNSSSSLWGWIFIFQLMHSLPYKLELIFAYKVDNGNSYVNMCSLPNTDIQFPLQDICYVHTHKRRDITPYAFLCITVRIDKLSWVFMNDRPIKWCIKENNLLSTRITKFKVCINLHWQMDTVLFTWRLPKMLCKSERWTLCNFRTSDTLKT